MGLLPALTGGAAAEGRKPPEILADKTLVAWVRVDDLASRGGSVLTIGQADLFDAVVLGEKAAGKWMAGSEMFRRTQADQGAWPQESAGPQERVQVAITYEGKRITLYRNGRRIAGYEAAQEPPHYGSAAYAMFGWRHMGAGDGFFRGSIEDARIYARVLTEDEIAGLAPHQPSREVPWAWWDFGRGTEERTGRFAVSELVGGARWEGGCLVLNGTDGFLIAERGRRSRDRIHFRPRRGNFADPIPFFWKGEYHVFYLQGGAGPVPWQHIASRDLVHWKELPTALRVDGPPESWDGGAMFTGSVVESGGLFYCFYTGHNPRNPRGLESVRLATSTDLLTWTKQPDFLLSPDGATYRNEVKRDFRDPYPYFDPESRLWHLVLCANKADGTGCSGVFTSPDLRTWTPAPPLQADFQECPDLFRIGDTHYLIGGDHYSVSKSLAGPYVHARHDVIDRPGVYAGKRMFDGKRHVWVGWVWDTQDLTDAGPGGWGGDMCLPRELVPGPDGVLYVRPVREVLEAYGKKVLSWPEARPTLHPGNVQFRDGRLIGRAGAAHATLDVPPDGLIEVRARMSPDARLTLTFRYDEVTGRGYSFTLNPAAEEVITHGQGVHWVRKGCRLDTSRPVVVRAFLTGSILELFVNDQYAFTRRAYELPTGKLAFRIDAGEVEVDGLTVKAME